MLRELYSVQNCTKCGQVEKILGHCGRNLWMVSKLSTHVESSASSLSLASIRSLQVAKEHSEKMVKDADRKYMERRRYLDKKWLLHVLGYPRDENETNLVKS